MPDLPLDPDHSDVEELHFGPPSVPVLEAQLRRLGQREGHVVSIHKVLAAHQPDAARR